MRASAQPFDVSYNVTFLKTNHGEDFDTTLAVCSPAVRH